MHVGVLVGMGLPASMTYAIETQPALTEDEVVNM